MLHEGVSLGGAATVPVAPSAPIAATPTKPADTDRSATADMPDATTQGMAEAVPPTSPYGDPDDRNVRRLLIAEERFAEQIRGFREEFLETLEDAIVQAESRGTPVAVVRLTEERDRFVETGRLPRLVSIVPYRLATLRAAERMAKSYASYARLFEKRGDTGAVEAINERLLALEKDHQLIWSHADGMLENFGGGRWQRYGEDNQYDRFEEEARTRGMVLLNCVGWALKLRVYPDRVEEAVRPYDRWNIKYRGRYTATRPRGH